ncbi:WecB/TagA/CpsF family glycosyltransferase [Gordonia polyisoprenivorans]|uniref:WecB/TagA/CpsF family glycosyltransferase n=1 Tax=Gordonia polyisoprenivorans TaxID=84595 RepID=UPI0009E389EE|nr:WecB/TagA/CpsF family glycosyltransferase [Gordonia polyisoprenivorans]
MKTTLFVKTVDGSDSKLFLERWELFGGDLRSAETEIIGLARSGGTHLVVTANTDHLAHLRNNERLAEAYEQASLRLIDGMPIVLLLRILGARNISRVTGADLLTNSCSTFTDAGVNVVILGGQASSAEIAVERLRSRTTGGQIVHVALPEVKEPYNSESLSVANTLEAIGPKVVFICLGCPKQETWWLNFRDALPSGVYIGAGAAVDFASGRLRRAPSAVQRVGLEWLWRLVAEPRRLWKRYLVRDASFLTTVFGSITEGIRL